MPERITVVGSLNMDLVVRSARIPSPGETILGHEWVTVPGGKGANQAVAAARMGGQVSMIGRVGTDTFAQPLLDNLTTANIDYAHVRRDPHSATGIALITVDDHGENSIVVVSGANMRLSPQDVDAAGQTIASSRVLLLQLESPLETVIHAAQYAHQQGVTVVLNPAPALALPEHLYPLVDIIIPNETETALLTGLPVDTPSALGNAARALLAKGVQRVILTLGSQGALIADEGGIQRVPAFQVKPVDTTAAGDAFVGAFAVALSEGQPLEQSVRWGNAAGALATTKLGAQTSLPNRAQVLARLGE
jgi:ribokinase